MLEVFQEVLSGLSSSDIVFHILLLFDTLCTCFTLFRKKNKTTEQICSEDIQKLIDYHEKIASKLKEKIK